MIKKEDKIKVVKTQNKLRDKTDSFFYDGEIAYAKKNGNVYSVSASGDIRINIGEQSFNNNTIKDAIFKYGLTDKKLNYLEKKGKLTWSNNNWFEVSILRKGKNEWEDNNLGQVAYDYDSAIQLLKDTVRDD